MNEKQLKHVLGDVANRLVPASVDLWPAIRARLETGQKHSQKGNLRMNQNLERGRRLRLASAFLSVLLVVVTLLAVTPQGRALAQEALRFFNRAGSDTLPVQSWQQTPTPIPATATPEPGTPTSVPATSTPEPGTPTPDPSSILDTNLTVKEVEQLAGFSVREPAWLPGILAFSGASFEPGHHIARIFYIYADTNGLVLREEPIKSSDTCELCGLVGASAEVQTVQIGTASGEYVEGVWKLTDKGPVWEPDPYLKTLRWQADGMAYELVFMGPPDVVTKDDLIAIAASIK